jgi:ATP-dependent RNA helicase DeaD
MVTTTFASLGLQADLLEGVNRLGYEQPTPIQAKTIPAALSGRDLIGLSETGSGKTAAFGLPLLQSLELGVAKTQALVMCPTRELAVQVCEEIHRLASCLRGFHSLPVYGGAPMARQIKGLRAGCHLVVGTPGRIIDHLDRGNWDVSAVRMVVLDEADRMLDMGFKDDMERILSALPSEGRQTLCFSATMNAAVNKLIRSYATDPLKLDIERKTMTVESVEQRYYEVRSRSKVEVLSRLLDLQPIKRGVIFCNTKQMVDDCCEALLARGYTADKIHGDITQQGRERVISRFREGTVELLVATDVAARGLDIENVEAVFNYDLPYDPEDYVHRIGRTGRAGRSGMAHTFVFGKDIYRLQAIERFIRTPIKRTAIPSAEAVEGERADRVYHRVRERLEAADYLGSEALIDRLLDQGHTPTDIASALFSLLREEDTRSMEAIQEDREPFTATITAPPKSGKKSFPGKGPYGKKDGKKPFNKKWDHSKPKNKAADIKPKRRFRAPD